MQIIKTARPFVFKPIELDTDIELDIETDANDIKRGVGDPCKEHIVLSNDKSIDFL